MKLTNETQQRIAAMQAANVELGQGAQGARPATAWSAGDTVERSSQPSALPPPIEDWCGTPLPAPVHPYSPRPQSEYPRAVSLAKFLRDVGSLGPSSETRPEGDFVEVMIRRGSLVDGEDFGILVDKKQIEGPLGPANRFYVFTKLAEMAGPTPTKYYGPFDDAILPNE
jgi:hypothetical protein